MKIELDEGTGKPAAGRAEPIVNAFDTYALEMAARFLETGIAGEITTITIGDESSKGSIKNCLAVGASHGYVINDELFEGSDAQGTAYALRCAVRKIEQDTGRDFDIVFCGIETSDETSGQTGPMLAEMLGCSLVTNVVALEEKDGVLHVKQETEDGYNIVETAMPCVLTAARPNYDPRYPTIKSKMAARKMPIGELSAADIDASPDRIGAGASLVRTIELSAPPKRQAGIIIKEDDIEEAALKAFRMMTDANVL